MYDRSHHSSTHYPDMQEPLLSPDSPPSPKPPRQKHKHNRFKTLFFKPSIRDSGVSLSAAVHDPGSTPTIPTSAPCLATPVFEDYFPQSELDYLVTELASRFDTPEGVEYTASDRADSPTLGRFKGGTAVSCAAPTPLTYASVSGNGSPLPGASLQNSPLLAAQSRPLSRSLLRNSTPHLSLPPIFRSLALTDAKIAGQPIRYLSSAYRAGANALKIGSCTFLNLAYGADVECGLRVEPTAESAQSIMLQIVQRVVDATSGRTVWLLCSETDVTHVFTAEVRSELVARAELEPQDCEVKEVRDEGGENDIWIALARTMDAPEASSTARIPRCLPGSPDVGTALADLLSLLTELRFLHRHFFVLRDMWRQDSVPVTQHKEVAWMSATLYESLQEKDMLAAFKRAVKAQSMDWLAAASGIPSSGLDVPNSSRIPPITFRERILLPKFPGVAERKEEMGVVGVWLGQDAISPDPKYQMGCWVCFVVAAGIEEIVW